jgi:hypothetical protein
MNRTEKALCLTVIHRPYQKNMFGEEDVGLEYTVIATNGTESSGWVMALYNQRGDCSENRIRELKIGFGMAKMSCGQFETTTVFSMIGVQIYNIHRLVILKALPSV